MLHILTNPRLALILISAVLLMSCGKKFESGSFEMSAVPMVSEKYTAVSYKYSSSPGSSTYSYSYAIDFQSMKVKVQVTNNGSTGVTLPTAGTRSLTATQVSTLKQLINNLSYQSCMEGPKVFGGSSDALSLFSTTLSEADATLSSQCTGFETQKTSLALGGYQELVTYLRSL